MGTDETNAQAIERTIDARFAATTARLGRLVRIPSVSWAAFDQRHVRASAEAVAELARQLGFFDSVDVLRAECDDAGPGADAVVARRAAAEGMPTVMLYAHHDVQPPGEQAAWRSAPFEPTAREGRLYGRGAADDKAGVVAHLAAVEAFAAAADSGLGVTLFVEGEEEAGSPSFARFLHEYGPQLAADAIIVADSVNWSVEVPSLTVSLRGNVTFELAVSTLAHPVHSGMYGGAVPDSMLALIRLLSTLHDEDGQVVVEGLIADDRPVPDYAAERLRSESSLLAGVSTIGRGPLLSRLWNQPAITVTGMDAPPVAAASNTLSATTRARLSVRVAPGQDARDAFEAVAAHLRRNAPFGAQVSLENVDVGQGFVVADDATASLLRRSLGDAWGADPVEMGIGGSIPFIAQLTEAYPHASVLITGVEDPDTRAHSPNESLDLGVLRRTILAEALFLARLEKHVG